MVRNLRLILQKNLKLINYIKGQDINSSRFNNFMQNMEEALKKT